VLTKGAAPTTFVRANKALDVSSKTVRIKWRCAQTDLTTVEIGTSGAGTHVTKSIAGTTSGIVDITVGTGFTDLEFMFNSTGNNANPVYIDWIYVGTGNYSTEAFDASGSGHNLTVFGGYPTTENGKTWWNTDGLTNYGRTTNVLTEVPDEWTYFEEYSGSLATEAQTVLQYQIGNPRLFIFREGGTNDIRFNYWNGVASTTLVFGNYYLSHNTGVLELYANWLTGEVYVKRDGVKFGASQYMVNGVKPTAGSYLYFNAYQGALYFRSGKTTNRRCFSRKLTNNESWDLYQNPNLYEALPEYPISDGHSVTSQSGVIRTEMDSGPAKYRNRFTACSDFPVYQYYMSPTQWQICKQFYNEMGGAGSFDFTDPDTGEVWSANFLARPSAVIDGLGYRVTLQLEVRP
jgi:hypothetical protein